MGSCAVLHITSLGGGGVDRHVRDVARSLARGHVIWHIAESAEVLEDPAGRRALPLDPAAVDGGSDTIASWLRSRRVGLVHVHALGRIARRRAAAAARALGAPLVATLHDILFLRADGLEPGRPRTADSIWLAETGAFLRACAAVVAPSEYLARLAREHLPGLDVQVVPNGTAPPPAVPPVVSARPEFAARAPRHVAAVIGAIGPHKGSAILDELAGPLAGSAIAIVVIGYLDAQVFPGWRHEHLFVHGAYQDDEVVPLLHAYGARLALFPNRVPESFGYVLSDAWRAGLPALVPDEGALGERVRRHGGGWLLAPGASAGEIAGALRRRFAETDGTRVESPLLRDEAVPSLEAMTRSLDALYCRFGIESTAAPDIESPSLQALLATNLDGALFRQELVRVADELVQLRTGLDGERERAATFESEARAWIAKLEGDIATLQAELAGEVGERRALGEENARMRPGFEAFEALPSALKRWLLRRRRDA